MIRLEKKAMSEDFIAGTSNYACRFKCNKVLILWWIYIFFSTLCEHAIFGKLSLFLFVGYTVLKFIKPRCSFPLWPYLFLEITYIIYSIMQVFLGIAVNQIVALAMIKTLLICLFFNYSILTYAFSPKYCKGFLDSYLNALFWGFLFCLLLYGYSIGNKAVYDGRFSCAQDISIGPITISGHGPTALAALASNGLMIAMILYWNVNRKKALYYFSFFTLIIILTGSRKNLIFVIFSIVGIPFYYAGRKLNIKKIQIILFSLAIGVLFAILIFKVPVLYNRIGARLLAVLSQFINLNFSEDIIGESSIRTRAGLALKAKSAITQRPVWGWGLNNFSPVLNNGGFYTHNNFLEILVNSGIVGFVIYYCKYIYLIYFFEKQYKLSKKIYVKQTIKICVLLFITFVLLEYWQITYMFRTIYVLPLLMIAVIRMNISSDSCEVQ